MIILQTNYYNNIFLHRTSMLLKFNTVKRSERFNAILKLNSCIKRFVGTDKVSQIVKKAGENAAKSSVESQVPDTPKNKQSQTSFNEYTAQEFTTPGTNPTSSTNDHYSIKPTGNKGPEQLKKLQEQNHAVKESMRKVEEHQKLSENNQQKPLSDPSINNNSVSSSKDNYAFNIGAGVKAGILASIACQGKSTELKSSYQNITDDQSTYSNTKDLIIKEEQAKQQKEKERQEQEQKERLEQEEKQRKEQEEKERLEQERLEKERIEQERLEKERLEREEKERLEKKRLENEKLEKEREETKKKMKNALGHIKDMGNKKGETNDNIKPSHIPNDIKGNYQSKNVKEIDRIKSAFVNLVNDFKNPNNIFSTQIVDGTSFDQMSVERILLEAWYRKIIKINNQTEVSFITEKEEQIKLGEYKYGIKVSPLGIALYDQLHDKNAISGSEIQSNAIEDLQSIIENLTLIAIPDHSIETIIPRETQTHINLAVKYTQAYGVFDANTNTYKIYGYLTSQKGYDKISDVQFKLFQKQKILEEQHQVYTIKTDKGHQDQKSQHMAFYNNIKEISSEKIVILKWGFDYINTCTEIDSLLEKIQKMHYKPTVSYYNKNITIEDIFYACLKFDENKNKKIPQPQTDYQIEKEMHTKKEQQEKQKLEKEKNKGLKSKKDDILENNLDNDKG